MSWKRFLRRLFGRSARASVPEPATTGIAPSDLAPETTPILPPRFQVDGKWLVGADYQEALHYGDFFCAQPDTIVLHFTAGSTLESCLRSFMQPDRKASAHLIVGRDRRVLQMVPLDHVAYHAGTSRWQDRKHLNLYSIGIEIVNAGQLEHRDGRFWTWYGAILPAREVFTAADGTHWHAYPDDQVDAVFEVCRVLDQAFDISYILGHSEIAPGRKVDPGPAFPLEQLRETLGKPLGMPV